MITYFVALGLVFSFGAAPLAWTRSPKVRQRELERFARRVDLPLTPEVEAQVLRRLVRRSKHVVVGGLAGLVVVGVAMITVDGFAKWEFAPLAILALVIGGVAVGAGTSAIASMLPTHDDGKRVARLSAPRYADYVVGFERWGAVVAVALGVIAVGVGVVSGLFATPGSSGAASDSALRMSTIAAFITVGLAVVTLAASAWVSRAIVAHGQRATSELGLAWDDALRASALRDIVTVPILLGLYGFVLSAYSISQAPASGDLAFVMLGALLIGVVVAFGLAIYSMTSSPQQFYRRQLWPNGAQDAGAR